MKNKIAHEKCIILSYTDTLVEVKFIESGVKVFMPRGIFIPSRYIQGGQEFIYEIWMENNHKYEVINSIHNNFCNKDIIDLF